MKVNTNAKAEVRIPEPIGSQVGFRRKFGFAEMLRAFVFLPRAAATMIANQKSRLVEQKFLRRLELAVTEVNGCPACSYQHTKMALRDGMSNEEIASYVCAALR